MKALVTGSSGFIGTWLCEHLRTRGVDVVTVGRPTSVRSDHRVGDITDGSLLADVLHRISPDYVFHAAGTAKAARSASSTPSIHSTRRAFCRRSARRRPARG